MKSLNSTAMRDDTRTNTRHPNGLSASQQLCSTKAVLRAEKIFFGHAVRVVNVTFCCFICESVYFGLSLSYWTSSHHKFTSLFFRAAKISICETQRGGRLPTTSISKALRQLHNSSYLTSKPGVDKNTSPGETKPGRTPKEQRWPV